MEFNFRTILIVYLRWQPKQPDPEDYLAVCRLRRATG